MKQHTHTMGISRKAGSAAAAFTKYGMYRSTLLHIMHTVPYIPAEYMHCLRSYKLLYWQSDYLRSKLRAEGFRITRGGVQYNPVFASSLPPGTYQVMLSFREAMPEFDIPAVVLISKDL